MSGRRALRGAAAMMGILGALLGVRAAQAQESLPLRLDPACASCLTVAEPRAPSTAEAILAVQVNLEPKGDFVVLIAQDGDVLVREADLPQLGLARLTGERVRIEAVAYRSLRGQPELRYAVDMDRLVLSIRVDPRVLSGRQVVDLGPRASPHVLRPEPAGTYFNYNVTHTQAAGVGAAADAAGEVGARFGEFFFNADAYSVEDPVIGARRQARLSTSLTRDERDTMRRLVLGDFLAAQPGPLGSSLRLGGISLSRRFGIDPYFVRFPGQVVAGTATLPSEVFVYSNGVLVRRERIPPGGFELQNLVNVPGLQMTEVVVRDVLGNEQRIADPFYYSESLLRPGLDEFSFDVGLERRDYGVSSAQYGQPGFTAFYRRGLSSSLTLGAHAEGLGGRGNAGPSASLRAGTLGVVTVHGALSRGEEGPGSAISAAHSFHSTRWSTNLALRLEDRQFARAAPDLLGPRRYDFAAGASHALTPSSGVSFSVTATAPWLAPAERSTSFGYRMRLTREVYLSATARHASGVVTANEVLFTFSWNFDAAGIRHLASVQARKDTFGSGGQVQLSGGNPEGEGLVYRMNAETRDDPIGSHHIVNPMVQWNARRAVLRAETSRDSLTGSDRTQVGVQGGVAGVGGHWTLSRPVADSFALVKVGEVPGVRVYANNQSVGTTDASGTVFVPRLASYFENPVAIEDGDLPINYIVPQARFIVSPALRTGVLIDFKAHAITAIAGRLVVDADGPAQAFGDAQGEVRVGSENREIVTSRDGSFYLEQVPPGSYEGRAARPDATCRFTVQVPKTSDVVAELGEVRCAP
jgi:outer membrane usher protein FimD/PapC